MGKRATRRGSVAEDIIVLLMLLSEAKHQGLPQLTKTQVHKFLFVSEQKLWISRILSTNIDFIKMTQGPWSQDIENILSSLENSGLLQITEVTTKQNDHAILTKLSPDAEKFILSVISEMELPADLEILDSIKETIEEYGSLSSEELQEASHKMLNLVTKRVIEDIPLRQYILRPRSETQATAIFDISDDIEETLAILLKPMLRKNLQDAMQSVREKPPEVLASLDELED